MGSKIVGVIFGALVLGTFALAADAALVWLCVDQTGLIDLSFWQAVGLGVLLTVAGGGATVNATT